MVIKIYEISKKHSFDKNITIFISTFKVHSNRLDVLPNYPPHLLIGSTFFQLGAKLKIVKCNNLTQRRLHLYESMCKLGAITNDKLTSLANSGTQYFTVRALK